ncbi:hypothetical protein AVEN_214374-1 [Araneus ventricosus]|uniref:Uncharacterized protein n=1 Tax=Araneus ventricosus TaxID=182803 RepID=A0A4Y2HPH9_ARAVE|nr:hypothetical protein AVEN_214374-1 [Araneus ventricosus]
MTVLFEKLIDEIKDRLSSLYSEVSFSTNRLAEPNEIEDAVLESCVLIDKYGANVIFSYPDRSKSSLAFMGNIQMQDVFEYIRDINSTNCIVKSVKQLMKELLTKELIPCGYSCDEALIENFLKDGKFL